MPLVTISEAARLTGKSAKTLYRMASQGRFSVSQDENGTKTVEISELMRVFGELRGQCETRETQVRISMSQREKELETRVRQLETALAAKDQVIEAQAQNLADVRQALKLLEAPKKRHWLFW